MPAPVTQQSQVNAAFDQIYLDTSDAGRLSAVGSNVGLPRPQLGLADDAEFRAIVRRIAQKRKLTEDAFRRLMETCLGPQYARRSALTEAVTAGAQFIDVVDASVFTPAGTIVLNPTQGTEDRVRYVGRDLENNRLVLSSPLVHGHAIVADASNTLKQDIAIGGTSAILVESRTFPTTGYPYPIVLSQGTEHEEVSLVTLNDTTTNTLTLLAGTANAHAGFVSQPITSKVGKATVAGQYFLTVSGGVDALENYPSDGWIRIDKGLVTEEVVRYSRLDVLEATFYFDAPLGQPHALGGAIDLVSTGGVVATAGVYQAGSHWEVYETRPSQVVLYIPPELRRLFLRDASWLHGEAVAPGGTVLDVAYNPPALSVGVVSPTSLPSGGLYEVNGAETFFAVNQWPSTPKLRLAEPLANPYLVGDPVLPVEPVYPGTNLADGNPIDPATGDWIALQFPGHYVYNPAEAAPSIIQTTLSELVCDPLEVVITAPIGRTCLEVTDAATWPTPPFSPLSVRIGYGSGFEEIKSCVDVTRAVLTSDTAVAPGVGFNNIGDLRVRANSTAAFPDTGLAGLPAGYRVIINRGLLTEQTVTVLENDTVANELVLASPLTQIVAAASNIELLKDVLTFSSGFVFNHEGILGSPRLVGHRVERLYDSVTVTNGAAFPTEPASVWINFGHGRISTRSRILSFPAANVVALSNTATFPTTDYPYPVTLTQGGFNAEVMFVTNNDTALNELTLSANPVLTHNAGEYVSFEAGAPEVVEYQSRTGNVLRFSEPVAFPTRHTDGETVTYSPGESEPNDDGIGYQFFLPPDPALCLRSVLDLVRAAGIEVLAVTER